MTQSPPPYGPPGSDGFEPTPNEPLAYAHDLGPVRPTGVTVIAIFGLILGSLGILSNLCGGIGAAFQGVAGSLTATANAGATQPVVFKSSLPTSVTVVTLLQSLLFLLIGIAFLAGGIGLLKSGAWSRPLMLKTAWVHIGLTLIFLVLSIFFVIPATTRGLQSQIAAAGTNNPNQAASMDNMMNGIMYGSVILGGLLAVVFPICVLIVLNRPNIKAALAGTAATDAPYPPGV